MIRLRRPYGRTLVQPLKSSFILLNQNNNIFYQDVRTSPVRYRRAEGRGEKSRGVCGRIEAFDGGSA